MIIWLCNDVSLDVWMNVWRSVSMSLIGLQDDIMIMLLLALDGSHGLRHDSMILWCSYNIYEFMVLLTWAWTWYKHWNENGVTTLVVMKCGFTIVVLASWWKWQDIINMNISIWMYGNDDKGTVTRPYFVDGTRRGK